MFIQGGPPPGRPPWLVIRFGSGAFFALEPRRPVVYLTQTTLATDETAEIVVALRRRFPEITAPPADDICTPHRTARTRSVRSLIDAI